MNETYAKKIRNVESTIKKLEKNIAQIEGQFAGLKYGTLEYEAANTKWQEKKKELKKRSEIWEQLVFEVDDL